MDKAALLAKFSASPDEYYRVGLFEEHGFSRIQCAKCSRYFWTQNSARKLCPDDDTDDAYSFIANPPTSKRFDYADAWRQIESFFVENGHESINRYPVACRWRDDLYFTIASIVDFQRPSGSGIEFEFPAHSLVVPQTCIRFNDLGNVGVTGRHFSSFCMVGQHSVPDKGGYWKDRCIELDYELLTRTFGIPSKEITFVEDVWAGGGSFGSSLEYFVNGLELGNAVFTEFSGDLKSTKRLENRVIDMGAGLERFAWITMGTPTAYDCCFGPITQHMVSAASIDADPAKLSAYYRALARGFSTHDMQGARRNAMSECGLDNAYMTSVIAPLERVYLVADHLRTLAFAITDGVLPSNVGGGYNLRVLLRRMMTQLDLLEGSHDLDELVDLHVSYLAKTYPEIAESSSEIKEIIHLEKGRYAEMRTRMESIAGKMRASGTKPTPAELVTLYESDGVPPDYLKELGAISEIPAEFYERLDAIHQPSAKKQARADKELDALPRTAALFHKDDPREFEARVLYSGKDHVVLDQTAFYARSGGQEPDTGTISGSDVTDVVSHAGVIVHTLHGPVPGVGQTVKCAVNPTRRRAITIHHTCTHILNSSARRILGSWVWQHSAFKDESYARLDITHHSSLDGADLERIESLANSIVRQNLPVSIREYSRNDAESKYGFRIYQGGVVPVDAVRIVSVGDFDVEACGGTHVAHTGEIGLVKIIRTERIQDGVIRLVFAAGNAALEHVQTQERNLDKITRALGADRQKVVESLEHALSGADTARTQMRSMVKRTADMAAQAAIGASKKIGDLRLYSVIDNELGADYHISVGQKATETEPSLVYVALVHSGEKIHVIVYAGEAASARIGAGKLVQGASQILGGSGGGNDRFGQGGGRDASRMQDAISHIKGALG